MKITVQILTYFFAAIYIIFGLNFFLNFIPSPPMEGNAGAFVGVIATTGFLTVVKIIEISAGVMIAANFRRPLAWLLILPISVNILLFEVFIAGTPGIGILIVMINAFMIYQNRERYQLIWSK